VSERLARITEKIIMKIITRFIYFGLAGLALACFILSQPARAVVPPPDGGYPNFTTAEGDNALRSLTTGVGNTAVGTFSLFSVTTSNFNTAVGAGALDLNAADSNTAIGTAALLFNTIGTENTANGAAALEFNESGNHNTATGAFALLSSNGTDNTATGFHALQNNTIGDGNTAVGASALLGNSNGSANTATGGAALNMTTTGNNNTAYGFNAMGFNTTGNANIALGYYAGLALTTGDYNIDIGNEGVAGEANTIRIGDDTHQSATFIAGVYGTSVAGLAVVMDSSDHLGTVSSSRRFKKEIKPMAQTSETILALKPVTFRYKKEIDPTGTAQFGLVAEEVEKVNPDLVARDKEGKPFAVRYDQVNAMLLNEFLKEHRKVQEQEKRIDALTAQLKEQAALIQKVSAKVELNKPAPQMVVNNQ
jgi:Chaperone of endosialidase